jgi:hypothetical protein
MRFWSWIRIGRRIGVWLVSFGSSSFVRSSVPPLLLPSTSIYTHILMIPHPGNHHSIRAEHEKSFMYFMRVTQLDRTYLSAWTLMGHECVEMKNSHAAIEAYMKAVGESFSVSIV